MVVAGSVLVGAAVVSGPALTAFAAGCRTNRTEVGSVDSDFQPDIAIASVDRSSATSLLAEVDVFYTGLGRQNLTPGLLDGVQITGDTGQSFGAAVTSMDLDHDGCSELIVGVPDLAPAPSAGIGSVDLLRGGPTGVQSGNITVLQSSTPYDHFGAAVAVASRSTSATGTSDLWIGAPYRTVDGLVGAGAVDHYQVAGDGTPTLIGSITADSPGIGGIVHAKAHFGSVLSADAKYVVIGAPNDEVDGQAKAGSATVVTVDPGDGSVASAEYWTQNSPGVPGAAEAGDRFGAAVFATGGGRSAVGVPDEGIGTRAQAGLVQLFGATAPEKVIDQNSSGVPGIVEAGDRFGASISMGYDLQSGCANNQLAIGSPGEDVGAVKDAGSVTVLPYSQTAVTATCAEGVLLTQGKHGRLGGLAETSDTVGRTVTVLRSPVDGRANGGRDRLLVGVPGEDVGSVVDAGIVLAFSGHWRALHFHRGDLAGIRFGRVLATPGGGPMFHT